MGLGVLIEEGEAFPRGYGIAYRDWGTLRAWCYPVPLHLVVGLTRRWYLWMLQGVAPSKLDRRVIDLVVSAWYDGTLGKPLVPKGSERRQ